MKSLVYFVVVCVVSVFFLHTQISAIMIGLNTERLTKESDAVVRGVVEGARSYWSADGRTIITHATIKIDEVVSGTILQNTITVEYPGGEIDGICLKVSDVVPLNIGEKVILFLSLTKSKKDRLQNGADQELHKIVGRAQGVYVIGDDGIARKSGFSLTGDKENIDNNIPVSILIQKIKEAG